MKARIRYILGDNGYKRLGEIRGLRVGNNNFKGFFKPNNGFFIRIKFPEGF